MKPPVITRELILEHRLKGEHDVADALLEAYREELERARERDHAVHEKERSRDYSRQRADDCREQGLCYCCKAVADKHEDGSPKIYCVKCAKKKSKKKKKKGLLRRLLGRW